MLRFWQFFNVFVSIILHVAEQKLSEGSPSTPKCSFCLTHCRVLFLPSVFQNFLISLANSVHRSTQNFFGQLFFVFFFENVFTVSFESFVLISLASTVLSNKSWRTSEDSTPFLSFANLSAYVKSIHQISLLKFANALIPLNIRVACVNLVRRL